MTAELSTVSRLVPSPEQIPGDMRLERSSEPMPILIDGKVRRWSGASERVLSPIPIAGPDGPEQADLGAIPLMSKDESLEALEAACRAYGKGRGEWPTMSVGERIRCIKSFLPLMEKERDEIVKLIVWEIGKTLPDARSEFDRTVDYIRATIEALKDLDRAGSRFALEPGFLAQIRRSPLGVVLCMGPFNYPLNETFATLIPALIMGNTVIFKPARFGALLYEPLLAAFAQAFPPGVVNTVCGDGPTVIAPLMESGRIDVLAFIGSAKVASILKHQHPRLNRLRCVLGLDAKNPAVILPDADLDLAARECAQGAFSFNGQRCTAIKIVFCPREIATDFCGRLAAEVEKLRMGLPWEEGVRITALPEPGKQQWLRQLVEEASAGGASIINAGGGEIEATYFAPAVLYPCSPSMRICTVEQFGPVLPIVPYDDAKEALDWIIDSPFGQQASLFGRDPRRLGSLIDVLVNQVCRVNLNSQCQRGPDSFPFTGRKDSAEGTLSISDALRVFSIRSLVAARSNETNEEIVRGIVTGRHSNFLSTDYIF